MSSIDSGLKSELCRVFHDRALFNESLAPYLAYRVGGPADALVFPNKEEELQILRQLSQDYGAPITVIGSGTNLLVRDEGIRGIVVSLEKGFSEISFLPSEGSLLIRVGGGVLKANLLNWAVERGYAGLEFSSGVPGTIGGGIYMNAGTKYGCYGDILTELRLFDFATGAKTVKREAVHFGYREQSAVGSSLVLSATFRLEKGDSAALRQEVDRIIKERAEKQPLDFPSCGSTFKNPEGHSAGRLIEKAGLKGLCIGGAEISTKHANFILNKNNATAGNILSLIDVAKKTVFEKFGVALECEVIILGGASDQGKISH